MLQRNNTVYLCSVPFTKGTDVLNFESESEQISYFKSKSFMVVSNANQVHEPTPNGVKTHINILTPLSVAKKCNYIMYKNVNENFYRFAFVKEINFVNDSTSRLLVDSDSWQNYHLSLKFKECLIERETPSSYQDVNTLSDTPSTGQHVETKKSVYDFNGGYIVFCSSDVTQDVTTDSTPYSLKIGKYNIPCWCLYWSETDGENMGKTLNTISNKGWGDRIISAVYLPFVNGSVHTISVGTNITVPVCTEIPTTFLTDSISFPLDYEEFGKIKTYPYQIVRVTDKTTGQYMEYAREKFSGTPTFTITGEISETPSYKIIPRNYEGKTFAYDKSLVIKTNTVIPHINNMYAKYMLNSSDSNQASVVNSLSNFGMSFLSQNKMGTITSGVSVLNTANSIFSQESQAEKLGNSISNFSDGAFNRLVFSNGIEISLLEMDSFHKKSCIDYWKTFGYPSRLRKTPNLNIDNGNYKYIKMIDCLINYDNIPIYDAVYIKNLFENGVTLWKPSFY